MSDFITARHANLASLASVATGAILLTVASPLLAGPGPIANTAFDEYAQQVEGRLVIEHRAATTFLVVNTGDEEARLRHGEMVVERLTPSKEIPDAMLNDWRGTAFVSGATVADFERVMRDLDAYTKTFAPEVLRSQMLSASGDGMRTRMRVRQHHVITVVMDTDYDVRFGRLDSRHGDCASTSTRIAEIDSPGTAKERELSSGEEHGFLWRLNSYWSYEERDGGLYMQIEAISLTRAVPHGLGWVVGPYVDSIPRESLEFTLQAMRTALSRPHGKV
ncbi:hypothetical protein ACFPT7_17565 [Acidicapsa dinghuensis]|uniref:Uncharacterized protein n=1 Tax=Acidicapsa dinghuensis TaxID=2218256 RepID=A0ABW1EJL0_9BACT|nr:hypothetical protein [Acidicapsa dinghuensis]